MFCERNKGCRSCCGCCGGSQSSYERWRRSHGRLCLSNSQRPMYVRSLAVTVVPVRLGLAMCHHQMSPESAQACRFLLNGKPCNSKIHGDIGNPPLPTLHKDTRSHKVDPTGPMYPIWHWRLCRLTQPSPKWIKLAHAGQNCQTWPPNCCPHEFLGGGAFGPHVGLTACDPSPT